MCKGPITAQLLKSSSCSSFFLIMKILIIFYKSLQNWKTVLKQICTGKYFRSLFMIGCLLTSTLICPLCIIFCLQMSRRLWGKGSDPKNGCIGGYCYWYSSPADYIYFHGLDVIKHFQCITVHLGWN